MSSLGEFSLQNHEGYKAAYSKLQEFNGERDKVESEISKFLHTCDSEEAKKVKDKRIQALIDGKNPDDIKSTNYNESLDKCYERKGLINGAIEKQRKTIAEQRMIASEEIMKRVGPQYSDIVKRQALQYIRLAEIVIEERELRNELSGKDISFTSVPNGFRPMPINFGDDPLEASSRFAMYIIECVEYGFLKEKDIPKIFKDSWYKKGGFKFKKTGLAAVLG